MATNDAAVRTLNSLIETTLDSVGGYREAAENVDSAQYKTMFAERATRRQTLANELQQEVRGLGGTPDDDGSVLGKLHNKFVDLKNAVTGGGSDKAVIDEVERGEDVIKAKFERASQDADLPQSTRDLVNRAYGQVKSDHDEVSRLKHSLA